MSAGRHSNHSRMTRFITAAREGLGAFRRTWSAYAVAEGRARAQRIRLASMTSYELARAARQWSGAIADAELRRRMEA